ncbi:MAG: hypothetical protein ACE5GL_10065, partial [Calditrichia bacterium]
MNYPGMPNHPQHEISKKQKKTIKKGENILKSKE